MGWTARILGLVYCAWTVRCIVLLALLFGWQIIFNPLWLFILTLISIVSLAMAWKWSGRRPEVVAGGIFIALGLFALIWCVYSGAEPIPLGFCLSDPYVMIRICLPIASGILFILAYKRTANGKS